VVLRLTDAMGAEARQAPAWRYWHAQALAANAPDNAAGGAQRQLARRELALLVDPLTFYGQLAADELGLAPAWPAPPAPPTPAEREAAARHPGLQRALQLMDLGLRSEGRREWNFSLREMDDRQRLSAARLACERADWQLCINTAERTRTEVDLALRYPMPWQAQIRQASSKAGLEPAYVFGLIRQETRFMPQLRSGVGASGLMQVMPGTAKLVARKLGLRCCTTEELHDLDTNLLLGTHYLRWALDGLDGSQALAAAAYNAGPGRPRRWREGATMDAAAWAEHVPFDETRDYVQKVLSNAAVYAGLLTGRAPTLRARLGQSIGPSQPGVRALAAGDGPGDEAGNGQNGSTANASDASRDNRRDTP
jgi:soluble lytic murein transglycosylase